MYTICKTTYISWDSLDSADQDDIIATLVQAYINENNEQIININL